MAEKSMLIYRIHEGYPCLPVPPIQTQLGHSSPTVTLNVYAHLMEPANQEAACRYENVIFEVSGSKMVAETKKEVTARNVTP